MHVYIWHCEHAMFRVEILMYKISLTHSCIYICDVSNFIFIHQ